MTKPLKSGLKHQGNYHQFHENRSNWPIWHLNGYFGEIGHFVDTVPTKWPFRRSGHFGLTAPLES